MSEPKLKKLRGSITYCYYKPKPELDVCFKLTEENCREFGILNNVSIFGIKNAKKQGMREHFSKVYKVLHAKGLLVDNPDEEHIRTTSDSEYQELVIEPFISSQSELLQLHVWTEDSAHEAANLTSINKTVNHQSAEVLNFIDHFTITDAAEKHGFYRLVPTETFAREIMYSASMLKKIKMDQCHRQSMRRNKDKVEMLEISILNMAEWRSKTLNAFYQRNVEKFSYAFRADQMIDDQIAWNYISNNHDVEYGIALQLKMLNRDPYKMAGWRYEPKNGLNSLKNEHIGINIPVFYVGTKGSVFALHTEDEDLASVNILVYGAPKVWYIIPPHEYKRVIYAVNKLFESDCTNYSRHKSTIVTPAFLEQHKITYSKVIQKLGEMMVVLPRSFHMGYNCGSNLALSLNFMPQYEMDSKNQFCKDTIYCSCDTNIKFNSSYSILCDEKCD